MTRIAAVFPGQGSQSTGMLRELAAAWPVVGETFAEASDALGYDLWQLVQENPENRLDRTEYTQPAMLTADMAVARTWQAAGGPLPMCTAGHSLGEYAALAFAGILPFADTVRLVAKRAALMQNAVPHGEGAMAVVLGLDDDRMAELCESVPTGGIVEPVNYNAPGQVVIAGHAGAVDLALEAATEAGARRAMKLAVSVPAHSSLMKEAAEALAEEFGQLEFSTPSIPVIHNVDAAPHSTPAGVREALRRQLYNPVRWTESVRKLQQEGAEMLLELGPGKVLAGLAKRIDRRLPALPVEDPATLEKALSAAS